MVDFLQFQAPILGLQKAVERGATVARRAYRQRVRR
jgi:hypothetical protein